MVSWHTVPHRAVLFISSYLCCAVVQLIFSRDRFYCKDTSVPLRSSSTIMMATCYLPPRKIKFLVSGGVKVENVSEPTEDTKEPFGIWMSIDSRIIY